MAKKTKKTGRSYPNCRFRNEDCFAYLKRKCLCLNSTRFDNRSECPFYKPADKAKEARMLCLDQIQ